MQEREVRMRVTEALATMGVRAASALIREAEPIVEWIMAGEDAPVQADKPKRAPRKPKQDGDKDNVPS